MIPKRNGLPMPGNGAKVSLATPSPPEGSMPPATPPAEDLVGGDAVPVPVAPVLDAAPLMVEPPRPKTAGRPGAPIQFSEVAVLSMIATLQNCLNPKVTFSEDVNLMRAEAHKQREEGLRKVLAGLKAPS